MKAAVYPFRQVLRGLREQAGRSGLQARELTSYENYERWESGRTRVGAQHLANIAAAFDVDEDLWLLVYAWLVDRFAPLAGSEPVEVTADEVGKYLADLPRGVVDLGKYGTLALSPINHSELALLCLTARYGPAYAGADRPLVLPPAERATVPPTSSDLPILRQVYWDVLRDLGRFVALTFILGGLGRLPPEAQRHVDRYKLVLFSEPELVARLVAAGAPPAMGRLRGIERLASLAARVGPPFERMTNRKLEELRRQEEDSRGEPVSIEEFKAMVREAARNDALWASLTLPSDEVDQPAAPNDSDAASNRQLRALHDQVDRAARRAINEELDDARATADPRTAIDALLVFEADTRDH